MINEISLNNLIPRKKGDAGLEGAGRPKGSKTKLPPLPPIVIDKLPFPVAKVKRGETPQEYWNRQAPKTLMYLFKRMDAFIVYQESGHLDPFGAEVFKMLGKELIKDIRTKAKKERETDLMPQGNEGAEVKKFRNQLVTMQQSFSEEVETISIDSDDGEFSPTDGAFSLMEDIDDEF